MILRRTILAFCWVASLGLFSAPLLADPAPPAGDWLSSQQVPGFRFKVRITNQGGEQILGRKVDVCLPETLCVQGAVAGRSEVFLRVVGPKPNGFLWPTLVKFSTSTVEVWVEQRSRGIVKYYLLAGASQTDDTLPGLFDRLGFRPNASAQALFRSLAVGPPPPPGDYLTSPEVPGFRFKVRITNQNGESLLGRAESACIEETLCASGAIPGRSEVFLRVVGPKPNGYLWPTFVKFTTSAVEIWVEQESTGQAQYYRLDGASPTSNDLNGRFDRMGFLPCTQNCGGFIPKDDYVGPVPPLLVDPPRPAGGTLATLRAQLPGASAIQINVQGDGCGSFTSQTLSGADVQIQKAVGAFGRCTLTATSIGGAVRTLRRTFEVEPRQLTLPAVMVDEAIFVPGALPSRSTEPGTPAISQVDAPSTLINGGTAEARIQLSNPSQAAQITRVLVQVPTASGFTGYFEAPARRDGNTVVVDLSLASDFFEPTSADSGSRYASQRNALASPFQIFFQLVDLFGRASAFVGRVFQTQQVGSEDVQVSLSWDTQTDVDLHVVEPPPGEEIYWSNRSSITGGQLDLDSNPACSIDGVRNENITWPRGASLRGEHVVRVDYWSDCGGQSANYTVTTRVCGEVRTFRGFFLPGQADRGGAGSGVEITRFTPICNFRVQGRAIYDDRPPTSSGLGPVSTLPIRFARITVKRNSDDFVLATGDTDQNGNFDLKFANDGQRGYYVEVRAEQDSSVVRQKVENSSGKVYAQRTSGVIDERVEPDKTGVEIKATESGSGPAFNIFDVGLEAATYYRGRYGVTPALLRWLWTSGQRGSCTGNVSCFDPPTQTISVLSIEADRDEYDDLVLLHEFGHKWQHEQSGSEILSLDHSPDLEVDPRLAWQEGSATFFGNQVKGSALYLDTIHNGLGARFDIETLSTDIPLGTSTGSQVGDLSEGVVAGILWDLADAANESDDTVSETDKVFSAASYLHRGDRTDRGVTGVDLVDLLDGWFCLGHGQRGDAHNGVEGIVMGIHRFPYDFAEIESCR